MRGVILAGGIGSRLAPLTDETNKHLLRVHNHPMIQFAVEHLADAGLTK